jgi:hypothetical protein
MGKLGKTTKNFSQNSRWSDWNSMKFQVDTPVIRLKFHEIPSEQI